MRVLLIRHAIAEDRAVFAKTGQDDGLRPLTRVGRRKMRRAARGLLQTVPRIDLLATSPLKRAVQTADLVADAYGLQARGGKGKRLRTAHVAALAPGKPPKDLLHWLQGQPADVTVALVGHEPDLGTFASWLLTGLQESFVPMKKGAACLLEFKKDVKAGRAELLWAMKPSQLRVLGRPS
jgi:phosphohistidine phosphatase